MKHFLKRSTSFLLAIIMLVSVLTGPVVALMSGLVNSFKPTAKGNGESMVIDFDYADTVTTSADEAKSQIIDYRSADATDAESWQQLYSNYQWKHVGRRDVFYKSAADKLEDFEDYAGSVEEGWDSFIDWVGNNDTRYKKSVKLWKYYENRVGYHVTDTAFNELKPALESTADSDKYIVLDTDFTFNNLWYLPESIKITSPKVLDLNGHSIYLNDITNRAFSSARQNDHEYAHYSKMFDILNNGSLTIIDSSQISADSTGSGGIYTNNYMTDVFASQYNYYTSRDIFWVDSGGELVIYGGTYQAGRYKHQREAALTWDEVKKVAGAAVNLGVNISEYAYGIKGAQAALQDKVESYAQEAVNGSAEPGISSSKMPASEGGSTVKKDGSNGVKEEKVDTPKDAVSRVQAVGEKTAYKNAVIDEQNAAGGAQKPKEDNKANNDKSAKAENEKGKDVQNPDKPKDGKNVTLNNLEKNITDAALDKGKLSAMAESAIDFANAVADLFTSKGPRLVQSTLGTVVRVGNGGTFVSYGGDYIGTGSTANTRNAVVEVVEQMGSFNNHFAKSGLNNKFNGGLAYIYGGDFEAQTGANVFNIVKANDSDIKGHYQTVQNASGEWSDESVTIYKSEVFGGYPIGVYDDKPISTRSITVRGGNFNCSAEISMAGLWTDGKVTMFPGTPGSVNLGIESYGKDFIKDGRIQIRDTYGDGALVLMDETKDENEQIHHYRLFCSELELRYNRNLQVYPGSPEANTTHSFRLVSTKGERNGDNTLKDLKKNWTNDENGSERNSVFADNEQYFELPINPNGLTAKSTTGHYYIIPSTSELSDDVYGENLDSINLWYYSTPLDTDGNKIETFDIYNYYRDMKVTYDDGVKDRTYNERRQPVYFYAPDSDGRYQIVTERMTCNKYLSNLKWFHYKVYRVDPLSRENISESNRYGKDVPLADIVYGARTDSLKCMLPLTELEEYMKTKWTDEEGNQQFKGFQPGEMYRVVFSIDESLSYNYSATAGFYNKLDTASMTSSVLFTCSDEKTEIKKNPDTGKTERDYTPLQWKVEPAAGERAKINIVNGKAGQTDVYGKKIFDVYYQWYEVDDSGQETLLAGTNQIYTGNSTEELSMQTIANIDFDTANKDGGYLYKNTIDPALYDEAYNTDVQLDENGMPKNTDDWTCEDFHAYSYWFMGDTLVNEKLFGGSSTDHSLARNYQNIFATNTDSCYIPESAAGKTIYCKAIVVNTYWPLNYDHVQVFTSHKVQVAKADCKVLVEAYDGFDEYTVKGGEKFTLPPAIESPYVGKVFDRWEFGQPGDQITVNSNVSIKAVWKEKTADTTPKVMFESGSGSGSMETVTLSKAGSAYKLPKCTFSAPSNKVFERWYVTDTADNFIGYYYPGDSIKVNKAIICQAEYYGGSFSIYRALLPTADMNEARYIKKCSLNSSFTLPELPSDWTRYGDTKMADSWNLGKPGETVTLTPEIVKQYGKGREILLYPAFRDIDSYTVKYNANGGSFIDTYGSGTTYTVVVSEADTNQSIRLISDDSVRRYGYEFTGWSLGQPGESVEVEGSVTINAQWKKNAAPAENWDSDFDSSTGTLTISGSGIISPDDGNYVSSYIDPYDIKHLVFEGDFKEINKQLGPKLYEVQSITLPSSLEKLGPQIFMNCTAFTAIDIPAKCKTIGANCFQNCYSLTTVTFHEGLQRIGKDCFTGCDELKTLSLPKTVKLIGAYAFGSFGDRYLGGSQTPLNGYRSGCYNFVEDFTLNVKENSLGKEYAVKYGLNYNDGKSKPAPVTNSSIGYTVDRAAGTITITGTGPIPDYNYFNAPWNTAHADANCHKLIISEGITSVGKYAFAGMYLTEVSFPSTLEKIDDYAFIGCDTLGYEKGITFPDRLESIGTAAFRYVGAKTITFGSGDLSIGNYAFCDRKVLTITTDSITHVTGSAYAYDVTIPANVVEIGDYAFGYYCPYDAFDVKYNPYTLEAPISNLGGLDSQGEVKNMTIVTAKGSIADNYAEENGFNISYEGVVNYLLVGDVNYDGVVGNGDLKYFDLALEEGEWVKPELKAETADINRDGKMDEGDRELLQICLEDPDVFKEYILPIRVIT
ncbi:MAG: leucine-rich repeat domain-containing protein [Clostridia bacterium]|nr:leucine-rich repeat domain-containing protein [Clostridia bacterium]